MRSILNSVKKIDDFRWIIGTYLISIIYISVVYIIGLIIPKFKKVITEYEQTGSGKSISTISMISSIPFTALFGYIYLYMASSVIIKEYFLIGGMYIGYFVFGFFAMTLWYDYVNKAQARNK